MKQRAAFGDINIAISRADHLTATKHLDGGPCSFGSRDVPHDSAGLCPLRASLAHRSRALPRNVRRTARLLPREPESTVDGSGPFDDQELDLEYECRVRGNRRRKSRLAVRQLRRNGEL